MQVYQITNHVNGKIYIGQHAGTDLHKYWKANVKPALKGNTGKTLLYRAIRKYGEAAFTISSLVRPIDKQQMDALEIFFIRTLETQNPDIGYNITAGGGGVLGLKFSEESVEKMRKSNKGISRACRAAQKEYLNSRVFSEDHLENLSTSRLGMVFSEEHRKNISASRKGKAPWNKGKKMSAEHCSKLSAARKLDWEARSNRIED